jgi:hypothetical protein
MERQAARYVVRWDGAVPTGWRIWDTEREEWTAEPAFGKEHVATSIADSLNRRAAESAASQRLWGRATGPTSPHRSAA